MSEGNKVLTGKRGYLIDFHRNDLPEVSFKGFNREQYRQYIKKANIDNIMIYAKDHWGYAYYPSKIGPVHPKLQELNIDLVAEVKAIAEAEGVDVCIYYSIDTDQNAAKVHPDWAAVDNWGKPVTAGGRWRRCSIGHEYQDYVLAQVREILEGYQPKGLFFDCFPSVLCFCEKCRKRYKGLMGKEMPLGEEVNRQWRDLHTFEGLHYWLPLAKKIRELIETLSPHTALTTNGCNANMPEYIRELYDYHFAEPWAGNYLSAGFVRDIMKAPQIGPGNIGMVYDSTPWQVVQRELLSIGMQGVRPFLYSESMKHDGSLIEHEWKRIGRAYSGVEAVEAYWTQDKPVTDISIIYSELSHIYAPEREKYNINWWERDSQHLLSLQSAMTMAASMHRGYGFIQENSTEAFASAVDNLLVVPNARVMPQESWEALAGFVEKGGKALFVLDGSPVNKDGCPVSYGITDKLLGCRLVSQDVKYMKNNISSYVKFRECSPIYDVLEDFPQAVTGPRLVVESGEAEVWAEFLSPVLEVDFDKEQWLAWRPPNPSNNITGPAVLHNRYGKGEVVLICFDILSMAGGALAMETGLAIQEAQKWYWPGMLLNKLVALLSEPKITLKDVSKEVCASYFKDSNKILVHLLNKNASSFACSSGKVLVNRKLLGDVMKAEVVYPERFSLKVDVSGDKAEISLPSLDLYSVIEIYFREQPQ